MTSGGVFPPVDLRGLMNLIHDYSWSLSVLRVWLCVGSVCGCVGVGYTLLLPRSGC